MDKKKKSKEKETPEKNKSSKKPKISKENKILRNTLIVSGLIILFIILFALYVDSVKSFDYKGIKFETVNQGTNDNPLIFYETTTLLPSNDGTDSPFGFRLRTKPSKLKKIDFENLEDFELRKINGYSYGGNDFLCEGDGTIAMANLQRTFTKMGMSFIHDENSTCDDQGRYNYFILKYGDETRINQLGETCYEIIIQGDENSCEILPATEKLMVEIFVKYRDI